MKRPLQMLALAGALTFVGAGIAQASEAPFEISMRREGEVAIVQLQPAPSKPRGRKGETCYEAKLKDYQKGMGPEAPVSYDLMNEWRGECAMPPL